ncbi:MAG: amidophosphoribosyltransferase [Bacteroidota bacterium]
MNNQIDKPTCNCGIIGVFGHPNASLISYYALHALQHRGQEAAGILSSDYNSNFYIHKGMGLVSEVFADPKVLTDELVGNSAIGHNRYSTTGASDSRKNIQPFFVNYRLGNLAVAHNGNLTNAKMLRDKLVDEGAIFQTTSDTEVILHLIARSRKSDQIEQVKDALSQIQGAFSLVILTDDKLIAARDKFGFRPLSLGKLNGAYIVTSETCALDINSATYIRDVAPGEIIVVNNKTLNDGNISSYTLPLTTNYPSIKKHCIFEFIYFSRPDSQVFGSNVDKMRRKLGKILATNHPVRDKNDEKVIVISVPDSSNTTAIGYYSGLSKLNIASKLEIGLIRSHYIGRTFIAPTQQNREIGVKIKFNIVKGVLENKTIVVIDDSIVRGTTSKQLIKLLREAKPKEIHLRISSPMITHPCFYGMNFPSKEELIANKFCSDLEEIRKFLDVDTLEYLTIEEMLFAMKEHDKDDFCTACFSGQYPIPINEY